MFLLLVLRVVFVRRVLFVACSVLSSVVGRCCLLLCIVCLCVVCCLLLLVAICCSLAVVGGWLLFDVAACRRVCLRVAVAFVVGVVRWLSIVVCCSLAAGVCSRCLVLLFVVA